VELQHHQHVKGQSMAKEEAPVSRVLHRKFMVLLWEKLPCSTPKIIDM